MRKHVCINLFSFRHGRDKVYRPSRKTPRNLHEKGTSHNQLQIPYGDHGYAATADGLQEDLRSKSCKSCHSSQLLEHPPCADSTELFEQHTHGPTTLTRRFLRPAPPVRSATYDNPTLWSLCRHQRSPGPLVDTYSNRSIIPRFQTREL